MPSRPAQRRIVVLLAMGAAALLVAAPLHLRPYARAWLHDHRVRTGVLPGANTEALGQLGHPAAVPYLESYVRAPVSREQGEQALRLLYAHYPDSPTGRATREFERIVGGHYFGGFWPGGADHLRPLTPRGIEELRLWARRHPGHPGCDDAYLTMAGNLEEERPLDALDLLHDAYHAPDGDKRMFVANRFQRVLERYATVDQLRSWFAAGGSVHLLDNVVYVLSLKLMRRHRFSEALDGFDGVLARASPSLEMAPRWPRQRGWIETETFYAAVARQRETCRWFAEREAEASRAGEERRGAILQEMGLRCFREEDLFANCLYYPLGLRPHDPDPAEAPRPARRLPASLDGIHDGNHYRQAAEFFLEAARECPGYSRIEEVEYSIPLCLWRLQRDWPLSCGEGLRAAIHEGFQDFATRHPRSAMADNALYVAGIQHWYASGRTDESVIRANLRRIFEDYRDGDVMAREGARVLRWAGAEREEEPQDATLAEGVSGEGPLLEGTPDEGAAVKASLADGPEAGAVSRTGAPSVDPAVREGSDPPHSRADAEASE